MLVFNSKYSTLLFFFSAIVISSCTGVSGQKTDYTCDCDKASQKERNLLNDKIGENKELERKLSDAEKANSALKSKYCTGDDNARLKEYNFSAYDDFFHQKKEELKQYSHSSPLYLNALYVAGSHLLTFFNLLKCAYVFNQNDTTDYKYKIRYKDICKDAVTFYNEIINFANSNKNEIIDKVFDHPEDKKQKLTINSEGFNNILYSAKAAIECINSVYNELNLGS